MTNQINFPKSQEETNDNARAFFRKMNTQQRANWHKAYTERLQMLDDPNLFKKIPRAPWMRTAWEKGLQILEEVMMEKNELTTTGRPCSI